MTLGAAAILALTSKGALADSYEGVMVRLFKVVDGRRDLQGERQLMRVKCREGKRLVYYSSQADQAFWEEYWGKVCSEDFALPARGYIHPGLRRPFLQHLPKSGKILEAGCGAGYVVLALRVLGYGVEGVDWAEDLVSRVKKFRPELPIRAGDVTALDVSDGTYRAVISLGVAEHRFEGPEPFIAEAFRVLEPGGVLLVSVPHFHVLRRFRYRAMHSPVNKQLSFYQYAFTSKEFASILGSHGFVIVGTYGYEVWDGLHEDFPVIASVLRIPIVGRRIPGLVNRFALLSRIVGHMVLFVAKKPYLHMSSFSERALESLAR